MGCVLCLELKVDVFLGRVPLVVKCRMLQNGGKQEMQKSSSYACMQTFIQIALGPPQVSFCSTMTQPIE